VKNYIISFVVKLVKFVVDFLKIRRHPVKRLLEEKVAVVTGAGRGIGRAEALALAAEGAKVVVNDLGSNWDGTGSSNSPADEVVQEIKKLGGEAAANYDTVATFSGGENIINAAINNFGKIDILVNNAGVLRNRMVYNLGEEDWDTVIKVHLYGHFNCTRPACMHFRKQRSGRIINTSSISGLGVLGGSNYSAAKEGILGFTRTVALDMAKYGVTCNAICPAADSRLWPDKNAFAPAQMAQSISFPMAGVTVNPEDVAKFLPESVAPIVVYLASDASADITGKTFWVAGNEIGIFREREIKYRINKDSIWNPAELVDLVPKELFKES